MKQEPERKACERCGYAHKTYSIKRFCTRCVQQMKPFGFSSKYRDKEPLV